MFRCNFVRMRLGRRTYSPNGAPISTDNYIRIPSAPLSHASTHTPTNSGTHPGLQLSSANICSRPSVYGQLSSLTWKTAHQHPPGEICALTPLSDREPFLDERCDQSSASETARIPTTIRTDPDAEFSHECQDQGCCVYEPAVPAPDSYNDFLTPLALSDHPLSSQQSSGDVQQKQHIPTDTSSHFPNNEFFPVEYQYVPATPHHHPINFGTISPAIIPIALGTTPSSTLHERGLASLDSPNAVVHEGIIDPISHFCESWCWPTDPEWMCAVPNSTAQFPYSDRYNSYCHTPLTLSDSRDITSKMLYMSHNARTPIPQLQSSPNHTHMSSPSPENLYGLLAWDSPHGGQDATPSELSSPTRASIEAHSVPPVLRSPQSESVTMDSTVAEKKYHCPLCGMRFTQSQVLNRHVKDKHEDKGSCAHCSRFKWSRGRPHLYKRHLRAKHPELTFSENPPGGTRKTHVSRARQSDVQKTREKRLFLQQATYALTNSAPEILSPQL